MSNRHGEIALVSGAAGALGAEVARTLGRRGDRVILLDHPSAEARLQNLAASLPASRVVVGDAADEGTWASAMALAQSALGGPPCYAALVAGGWRGDGALHELAPESERDSWREMMTTNLETVHRGLVGLLPAMVAARRGSVVVVGSRAAERPWTNRASAAYVTAKSAVVALEEAVAAEVSEHGVRVNAVLPSALDTPSNRKAFPKADPTKWVSLDSAAGVIAFLLSDASRDISGAAIPLYGRAK